VLDASGRPVVGGAASNDCGISRLTFDLIRTNDFETIARGCLSPNCN
jgi:hypothetical protein